MNQFNPDLRSKALTGIQPDGLSLDTVRFPNTGSKQGVARNGTSSPYVCSLNGGQVRVLLENLGDSGPSNDREISRSVSGKGRARGVAEEDLSAGTGTELEKLILDQIGTSEGSADPVASSLVQGIGVVTEIALTRITLTMLARSTPDWATKSDDDLLAAFVAAREDAVNKRLTSQGLVPALRLRSGR